MKRILALVLVLLFSGLALADAEDRYFYDMTDDELLLLRQLVNYEIATRFRDKYVVQEGTTIADIFPDPVIARYIRDQLGAFTPNDVVTQDQLDTVTKIEFTTTPSKGIVSLEGIQYLTELKKLFIYQETKLKTLPDGIGNLSKLESVSLIGCGIQYLPDSFCNLTALEYLDLSRSPIKALPEDIGNLTNLRILDISHTKITYLPRTVYNLTLEKFYRAGLDY